jgi:hypothetical protein
LEHHLGAPELNDLHSGIGEIHLQGIQEVLASTRKVSHHDGLTRQVEVGSNRQGKGAQKQAKDDCCRAQGASPVQCLVASLAWDARTLSWHRQEKAAVEEDQEDKEKEVS